MSQEHQLVVNGNTYINIATVIIIIAATLWIKDGQSVATQMAKDASNNLGNYKEVQIQAALRMNDKLDSVMELVKKNQTDWSRSDSKLMWRQLKAMNPNMNVPEVP